MRQKKANRISELRNLQGLCVFKVTHISWNSEPALTSPTKPLLLDKFGTQS
jgi:hypothetical protein